MTEESDCNESNDEWAVLVLVINQDVLQRIPVSFASLNKGKVTVLGGESCMLVMSEQNYKWRVEIQDNSCLVEMLDKLKAIGLQWLEVMCLVNWQKRITTLLFDDWLTETEYCNMRDEISLKHDEVAIAENDTCLLRFVKDL